MNTYPRWFFPGLLMSLMILLVTGVLLIPTTLDTRFEMDVVWRLMGDGQIAAVSMHNIFSYLMMLFIGALTTVHSRVGLRRQKNVHSGIALITLFLLLMLSGAGLLYLGDEQMVLTTSAVHIIVGLLVFVMFTGHYINAKINC